MRRLVSASVLGMLKSHGSSTLCQYMFAQLVSGPNSHKSYFDGIWPTGVTNPSDTKITCLSRFFHKEIDFLHFENTIDSIDYIIII